MSQVPGLGHVTSYRHSTLFHSPLVGVDKETVATSTLGECRVSLQATVTYPINTVREL
jgi:hypothetical protein